MVYKWADENPEKRKDKVVTNDIEKSNRDEGEINHFNRSSSSSNFSLRLCLDIKTNVRLQIHIFSFELGGCIG